MVPQPGKPIVQARDDVPRAALHPVRRVLAEDKLETQEIVLEPAEVQAQPEGWRKISEERTSQLDWVAPKIIQRVIIRPRYVKAERFALAPLPPQPIEQGIQSVFERGAVVVSQEHREHAAHDGVAIQR